MIAYWPALLLVAWVGTGCAVLGGCNRAEPASGRSTAKSARERHEGRHIVGAPCRGAELELALKVGLSARVCRTAEPGSAELAVAGQRVEASAVAPGFVPAGPTFRVRAAGPLSVGYATERYTPRPAHRPVLILLDGTGVAVQAASFEAQRFDAELAAAPDGLLQFGLLPVPITSGSSVRSAAP